MLSTRPTPSLFFLLLIYYYSDVKLAFRKKGRYCQGEELEWGASVTNKATISSLLFSSVELEEVRVPT